MASNPNVNNDHRILWTIPQWARKRAHVSGFALPKLERLQCLGGIRGV